MLDPALEEALAEVAGEVGQPQTVARRLVAWLKQMSESELDEEDNVMFLTGVCQELAHGATDAD